MATRRRKLMEQAVRDVRAQSPKEDIPPGTEIVVTWGEEVLSPVQYNSFRIGGHSITVIVQEGESALEAWKRGWAILQEAADIQFRDKLKGFQQRLDTAKGR